VLPFYRSICPRAERVCVHAVCAICAARLDKCSLAGPCASPHTSAFLRVVVAIFSGVRKKITTAMLRQNQFIVVFDTSMISLAFIVSTENEKNIRGHSKEKLERKRGRRNKKMSPVLGPTLIQPAGGVGEVQVLGDATFTVFFSVFIGSWPPPLS